MWHHPCPFILGSDSFIVFWAFLRVIFNLANVFVSGKTDCKWRVAANIDQGLCKDWVGAAKIGKRVVLHASVDPQFTYHFGGDGA